MQIWLAAAAPPAPLASGQLLRSPVPVAEEMNIFFTEAIAGGAPADISKAHTAKRSGMPALIGDSPYVLQNGTGGGFGKWPVATEYAGRVSGSTSATARRSRSRRGRSSQWSRSS